MSNSKHLTSHEAAGDDGGDDEAKLLRTFPAEIWQLILKHVKEAQPYHSISNASPTFRTWLLPRAPKILFPSAAPLILRAHQDLLGSPSDPEIVPKTQLPLRGVCRAWREGVDQVLQTQHFNPDFPVVSAQFSDLFTVCLDSHFERFHTVEDFSRFDKHFQSTHHHQNKVNPFLCRAVVFSIMAEGIDFEERVALDQYYQTCADLLLKYGHHVWYCVIIINPQELPNPEQDQIEFYLRLRHILRLMPNLRALEIQVMFPDQISVALHAFDNHANTFPTLGHLRYLQLSGVPPAIVHGIVNKNPQVTQVEASRERLEANTMRAYLARLPNLKELALCVEDEHLFQTLSNSGVICPVKKMSLEFGHSLENKIAWNTIFTTVEHHFSHLTQLTLSLPGFQSEDIWRYGEQLQFFWLPKLKVLNLKMVEAVSLDFLLPMSCTLEELSVQITSTELKVDWQFVNKQILNVLPLWEEPHRCSLWTIFPKLKLVKKNLKTVGEPLWISCTRAEWKAATTRKPELDRRIQPPSPCLSSDDDIEGDDILHNIDLLLGSNHS